MFIILHDIVLFFRPHELDFKYVMKVSSLKKRLPEAAFRKQNYLEQQKGLLKYNVIHCMSGALFQLFTPLMHTLNFCFSLSDS